MSKNNTYLALTIGPIYDTLSKARKIREIWAASYLFSYITRLIVDELEVLGIGPADYILPAMPATVEARNEKLGVGLWPDRLIIRNGEGKLQVLKEAAEAAVQRLAAKALTEFKIEHKQRYLEKNFGFQPPANSQPIEAQFCRYFRIFCLEIAEENLPVAGGETFVHRLDFLMDNLELQSQPAPAEPDYVLALLRATNRSFLIQSAFHSRWRFESLTEVATYELKLIDQIRYGELVEKAYDAEMEAREDQEPVNEEETLLGLLREHETFGTRLRTYHRYIAIVSADGDKIGSLVGKLGRDPALVRDFSHDLVEFAREANTILAGKRHLAAPDDWGYGAAPVYLGGDDLVFFAPVASRDESGRLRTVFDLVQDLDQEFRKRFKKYKEYGVIPTLSYGVAIAYYKYPMQEALEASAELLKAVKGAEPQFQDRNHLNFKVLKHSGKHYGGLIDKHQHHLYSLFLDLTRLNLKSLKHESRKVDFLAGLAHRLESIRPLLKKVLAEPALMDALFLNQFNEPIHKQQDIKDYLKRVKEFLLEANRISQHPKEALDKTYATLRFVHFINSNEHA